MAQFAAILPLVTAGVAAAGTIAKSKQDSNLLKLQAITASQQALRDEEAKRRENRELRGRQAAALAEAGLTPDGSSGLLLEQDAALAELDALNIRYKGTLRRQGFMTESKNARQQGNFLAGQQLLSGASSAYTQSRMASY